MLDGAAIQSRLNAHGAALVIDGVLGPVTYAALFAFVGQRALASGGALGAGAARYCAAAAIDTPLRIAHFLGQAAHESLGFTRLREIWGPSAAQARYEGRAALGNVQPGDGRRYLGRGLFQITGRANYAAAGKRIGRDLVAQPDLAEAPEIAVQTACDYWCANRLAHWADADDALALSRAINLGDPHSTRQPNGLPARIAATARAKSILL